MNINLLKHEFFSASPYIRPEDYPIAPDGEMTARIAQGQGIFERDSFDALMAHVKHHDVAVEVGSHVGSWTIGFSSLFNDVIGFEPQPTNREYLMKNLARCNVSNVAIHPLAVLDNPVSDMKICTVDDVRNSGMAHLILPEHANDNQISVECVRLDDHLKLGFNRRVGVIKIDVEGLELEVLKSGQNLIDEHQPTIMLEINETSERYGIATEQTEQYMSDIGYTKVSQTRCDNVFKPKI